MSSTRAVNYSIRANKHIERRMLFEVLQRLDRLPPRLSTYRYVGFGGIYFTDLLLAHRDLGISDLVSIEKTTHRDRFEFNKPLACIALRFDTSGKVLPTVLAELGDAPAIFWLDYDGLIDQSVIADAALVAGAATPWTVLIITVNCEPGPEAERLATVRRRLGNALPPDITYAAQLGGWKLGNLSHRMITGAIDATLVDRNAAIAPKERMLYHQLVRFHYADGAKMMTTGGIFCTAADAGVLPETFSGLPQLRERAEPPLLLDAPILTAREVRHLSDQLPEKGPPAPRPSAPGLAPSDVERFADMYRHYPLYAQVEVI